ncbi:MAG: serine/threonine protein kinase, partial [Vicinamibacteria bacterium]|nr:serine/threonine protein kinase [Vicinamibacteria bacterium]
MSDAIPVTLGRYVIHDEIGRGMMGRVYRAFDPELGRTIALKTIRLAFSASAEEQEQFERRFLAEARAAAILSHPNIVIVFDVGRDPDTNMAYIALEYLAGQTLEQMVAQGPLDWREACRIAARIADGLHHAHTAGIVHRDVKPANIVVLPSGVPKIMDFGIAKIPSAKLTLSGQFFGTPAYMSPEQIEGRDLDGRSDLFSLGAMLYLLLTGSRAFAGSSIPSIVACVQGQDPPMPSEVVAGIPAAVDLVVLRALAKDPAARYPDGRSFAEDLDDVREDRPPRHRLIVNAAPAVPAPEPAPAPLTSTAHEAATPPATASDPQSLPAPVIANDTRATAPSSSSA